MAIMQTYILLMKYIRLSRHFKIELKCRSLTIKNQATAIKVMYAVSILKLPEVLFSKRALKRPVMLFTNLLIF